MKKSIAILYISIGLGLLYNIICYCDTLSVLSDFNHSVKTQKSTYSSFDRYIGNYSIYDGPIVLTDSKIYTLYAIHNFKKGVMYVNYSYEHYNDNNEVIGGSYRIKAKWYIRRKNGKWIVYDIDEKP